jgi:hypothetical protein
MHEARDLRRFLLRPATLESFAAFGADSLQNCLDVPRAFGVTLSGGIRRTWWLRLLDLAVTLNTLANPEAPAMATQEGRERHAREADPALAAFGAYHHARVAPRVAELPPLPWHWCPQPHEEDAGGSVVPFAQRPAGRRQGGDDDGGALPPIVA